MKFSDRYKAIANSRLDIVSKGILFCLNTWANDEGIAHPGYDAFADMVGMTVSGLRKRLYALEKQNLIAITTRTAERLPNIFQIHYTSILSWTVSPPGQSPNQDSVPTGIDPLSQPGQSIEDREQTIRTDQYIPPIVPQENFENDMPEEEPDSRDVPRPTQAPISEKAKDRTDDTHTSSPPEQLADSEKHGLPPCLVVSQTEPDGGCTPPPSASRSKEEHWLDVVNEKWKQYKPFSKGVSLESKITESIFARIKEHSLEEFLLVIDWLFQDQHPKSRAVYLRDGKYDNFKTICRPENFREYLEFALEWQYQNAAHSTEKEEVKTPKYQPAPQEAQVWNVIYEALNSHIGREDAELWLSPCFPQISGGKLYLHVPNSYYKEWILENYTGIINTILEKLGYVWGGFGTPPPEKPGETNVILFKTKEMSI